MCVEEFLHLPCWEHSFCARETSLSSYTERPSPKLGCARQTAFTLKPAQGICFLGKENLLCVTLGNNLCSFPLAVKGGG